MEEGRENFIIGGFRSNCCGLEAGGDLTVTCPGIVIRPRQADRQTQLSRGPGCPSHPVTLSSQHQQWRRAEREQEEEEEQEED